MTSNLNRVEFEYSGIEEAFPPVDPQHRPCGPFVIVQIKAAKAVTKGGIHLPDEARQTDQDNTQCARVVAIGPTAFHYRNGDEFEGGPWYKVGEFVRSPKYGGDRWTVKAERTVPEKRYGNVVIPSSVETIEVEFAMFKEQDIRTVVTGDPLNTRAYI